MQWSADFETTTDPNDCRVWAWGVAEIFNTDNFYCGNDINELFELAYHSPDTCVFYFHNLKFDGEFILNWLFHNGYTHVTDKRKLKADKTFCTLISDKGMWYSIHIRFKYDENGHGNHKDLKIYDSLKVLPMKVEEMPKAFGLKDNKLHIDYNEYREVGHELTQQERDYIHNDVVIVAQALEHLFRMRMDKMTTAANAMSEYKDLIGKKQFQRDFPPPSYDGDIRQAYRGGWTYLNPKWAEVDVSEGIVLDVNSLYPSVMVDSLLPYGEGIFFNGQYKEDRIFNLYVQMFACQFELKPNHLPTIQLKNSLAFVPTEYLTSSQGERVTLCLTSVDLKLFFDHYDVYDIEYYSGWKWRSTEDLFKQYVQKWNGEKVRATEQGNKALRTIAKLMLNSLYGKFATSPKLRSKIPYLSEDGIVKYKVGELEEREPIYVPVAAFVTAWARNKTIRSAQKVYDRFIYADTDSLHLAGTEIPEGLEIHPTKLGAWKHESTFTRARFIRQKSYIEEIDGELKITCAGMPTDCYGEVTWDNFHTGAKYGGKKVPRHVPGGIILDDTYFTLRK